MSACAVRAGWHRPKCFCCFSVSCRFNSFLHIYTHFNTLKKKALGKHCGKRWNCSKWAISHFSTIFSMQSIYRNPLIATFEFSSAASLNSGRSQNAVLGNGFRAFTAWFTRLLVDIDIMDPLFKWCLAWSRGSWISIQDPLLLHHGSFIGICDDFNRLFVYIRISNDLTRI